MNNFNDIFERDLMLDGTPAKMERTTYYEESYSPIVHYKLDQALDGTPGVEEALEVAPTMEVQAMLIRDHFIETPELQYETWKGLTPEERLNALNGLEKQIAEISKRPPMTLVAGQIPEGTLCQCAGKYPNAELIIDEAMLADGSRENYTDTLDTLLREGRHAYQNYNLAGNLVEQNSALVNGWKLNYEELTGGYHDGSPDYNFSGRLKELQDRLNSGTPEAELMNAIFGGFMDFSAMGVGAAKWSMQPVEMDAAVFSEAVMDKLEL